MKNKMKSITALFSLVFFFVITPVLSAQIRMRQDSEPENSNRVVYSSKVIKDRIAASNKKASPALEKELTAIAVENNFDPQLLIRYYNWISITSYEGIGPFKVSDVYYLNIFTGEIDIPKNETVAENAVRFMFYLGFITPHIYGRFESNVQALLRIASTLFNYNPGYAYNPNSNYFSSGSLGHEDGVVTRISDFELKCLELYLRDL